MDSICKFAFFSILEQLSLAFRPNHSSRFRSFIAGIEPALGIYPVDGRDPYTISTQELGVATFSVKEDDIAIVDHDGSLYIHHLTRDSDTGSYIKHDVLNKKFRILNHNSVRDSKFKISWSPNSTMLAVPTKEVVSFILPSENDTAWKEIMLTADAPHDFRLVAFSPNGQYLAGADINGKILVWEINVDKLGDSKCLCTFSCAGPLVDLAWGRELGDNYIMVITSSAWGKIENVIPDGLVTPTGQKVDVAPLDVTRTATTGDVHENAIAAAAVIEPEAAYRRLQKNSSGNNGDYDDEEDALFDDDVAATSISDIKNSAKVKDLDEDGNPTGGDVDISEKISADLQLRLDEFDETIQKAKEQLVPLQAAFQPSETRADEKGRRYLVWNSIGNITTRNENDSTSRIEIRFANTMSRNKQEAFPDNFGFNMASLAYEGAIFATPLEIVDEDDFRRPNGSTIHYHAFPGFLDGANETFTHTLPEGEAALAVAVGCGWAAVATSIGFLRVFSSTGVQLSVTWLKGPIACLCGYGTQLAVVVNSSQPIDGTPRLTLELYSITPFSPGCSRSILPLEMVVPLSSKSSLQWVGFDVDTKFLTIIDSSGMCSMLMRPFGWQWVPVLDISKSKKSDEHVYWPVMVKGAKLVYVLLNGESRPAVYPQPVTSVKSLRMPIIEIRAETKEAKEKAEIQNEKVHLFALETAKASHWESLKTEETVFGHVPVENHMSAEQLEARFQAQENEADKTVVWMIQRACAVNRISQALDLAHKLRTMKGLEAAILVANHLGRATVAKKLQEIQDSRFPQQVEPEESYTTYQENRYEDSGEYDYSGVDGDFVGGQKENVTENATSDSKEGSLYHPKSKQVTPSVGTSEARKENPFRTTTSPNGKRKQGFDIKDLKNLKGSPSPSKKPMLSVS